MITTIFFDLDDTLLWDKQSIKKAFEETCQRVPDCDPQTLEVAVRTQARKLYESYPTYPFTQMIGINPFEGLWGTFDDPGQDFQSMHQLMPTYRVDAWTNGLKACGIEDRELAKKLADRFIIERKKHPYVYTDTFNVLSQLKGHYQLLLLTNGSPSLQQTKLAITPEIATYFDHIIISGEFGRGKPDRAIFDYALDKTNARGDQVVMVGDNLMTDILGANRTGIKNIWINHHGQAVDQVKPTYQVDSLAEVPKLIKAL
ncbi:HAD family hydrolase [Amphibacillus cookii]|uniref:HAD family hydrolase n=1 Tax=Amphibacillus cookii TaxID=767787 RepID=UPI001959D378|nr:HAD family hydrolase [Amphibacillus cookii]MBM7541329.1 putative hydrolase of the HAD superfamily [Amphibacillus cookii]